MKVLQKEQLRVLNLLKNTLCKDSKERCAEILERNFGLDFGRKLGIVLLSSIIYMGASVSAYANIDLKGDIKQGSLIIGKTAPNATVTLNNESLKVSANGDYAFGFSRDDETQYLLNVTLASGEVFTKTLIPEKREYKIQRIEGIKKSITHPNVKAQTRAKEDRVQVKAARAITSNLTDFATGFIVPLNGVVTGVYGSQRFYNGVPKSPHYGIDYAGNIGDPVKAPASGTVTMWVPDMFYSGGTMIIDHGHGINSTFLHLSNSYVKVGDYVKQGDVVAAVGNSGRTTGPHLDWRINWYNVRLDPALALKIQ